MDFNTLDPVFVITRGGRRADPENFLSHEKAKVRASSLINAIQKWEKLNTRNEVKIVKTTYPHRIR
jgi:hypothetical protein